MVLYNEPNRCASLDTCGLSADTTKNTGPDEMLDVTTLVGFVRLPAASKTRVQDEIPSVITLVGFVRVTATNKNTSA